MKFEPFDRHVAVERRPAPAACETNVPNAPDLLLTGSRAGPGSPVAGRAVVLLMAPAADRLLVVSPVYNEAAHLDRTARAVAAQTRRPDRWVIVDDGSTDETVAVARRWERELDFLTVVEAPQDVGPGVDNLALARPPRAFNLGLEARWVERLRLIGKLDGDVELPPNWYETLLDRFGPSQRLGLAAGRLAEPTPGGWTMLPIPAIHVHGAVKLYTTGALRQSAGSKNASAGTRSTRPMRACAASRSIPTSTWSVGTTGPGARRTAASVAGRDTANAPGSCTRPCPGPCSGR